MRKVFFILLFTSQLESFAQSNKILFEFYDEEQRIPNEEVKIKFMICGKEIFPFMDDTGILSIETDCQKIGLFLYYREDIIFFGEVVKQRLTDIKWIARRDEKPFSPHTPTSKYVKCKTLYYITSIPKSGGLESNILTGTKCSKLNEARNLIRNLLRKNAHPTESSR